VNARYFGVSTIHPLMTILYIVSEPVVELVQPTVWPREQS